MSETSPSRDHDGKGPDTFTVSDLSDLIGDRLRDAFPAEIWVRGEIHDLSRARSGHVYFTLVDAETDHLSGNRPAAQLAVMLPEANKRRVNRLLQRAGSAVRMSDGTEVRIRGRLDWFGPRGSLQLRMASIDPAFTLGVLAADRAALLARLRAEGVLEQNRLLTFPIAPLRIGLITSAGSAAEADVRHTLEASGFRFELTVADVRVQGHEAPTSVAGAVEWFREVDLIVIARGGGATSDLAAFDTEVVVRAIAAARVPVVTGIGHEVDRSLADEAAHSAAKTPTAAAALIVERVAEAHTRAEYVWSRIADVALDRIAHCDRHLDTAMARTRRAATSGATNELHRLSERATRLHRAATQHTDHEAASLQRRAQRLVGRGRQVLDLATASLTTLDARVAGVDPVRALARGWAMVRDEHGRLVRHAGDVEPGATLVTVLHDGEIESTVTRTSPS